MNTVRFLTFVTKVRQFALQSRYFLIGLVLLTIAPLSGWAQEGHSHTSTQQQQELAPEQKSRASALIRIVQESTERYKNVSVAEAEGYVLQFGCVSGPDSGAMGLHYINAAFINRGELDPTHYWESPNRFGLPAFYTLHVWAWKDNPNGAFVNWHPNVSCKQFGGQTR